MLTVVPKNPPPSSESDSPKSTEPLLPVIATTIASCALTAYAPKTATSLSLSSLTWYTWKVNHFISAGGTRKETKEFLSNCKLALTASTTGINTTLSLKYLKASLGYLKAQNLRDSILALSIASSTALLALNGYLWVRSIHENWSGIDTRLSRLFNARKRHLTPEVSPPQSVLFAINQVSYLFGFKLCDTFLTAFQFNEVPFMNFRLSSVFSDNIRPVLIKLCSKEAQEKGLERRLCYFSILNKRAKQLGLSEKETEKEINHIFDDCINIIRFSDNLSQGQVNTFIENLLDSTTINEQKLKEALSLIGGRNFQVTHAFTYCFKKIKSHIENRKNTISTNELSYDDTKNKIDRLQQYSESDKENKQLLLDRIKLEDPVIRDIISQLQKDCSNLARLFLWSIEADISIKTKGAAINSFTNALNTLIEACKPITPSEPKLISDDELQGILGYSHASKDSSPTLEACKLIASASYTFMKEKETNLPKNFSQSTDSQSKKSQKEKQLPNFIYLQRKRELEKLYQNLEELKKVNISFVEEKKSSIEPELLVSDPSKERVELASNLDSRVPIETAAEQLLSILFSEEPLYSPNSSSTLLKSKNLLEEHDINPLDIDQSAHVLGPLTNSMPELEDSHHDTLRKYFDIHNLENPDFGKELKDLGLSTDRHTEETIFYDTKTIDLDEKIERLYLFIVSGGRSRFWGSLCYNAVRVGFIFLNCLPIIESVPSALIGFCTGAFTTRFIIQKSMDWEEVPNFLQQRLCLHTTKLEQGKIGRLLSRGKLYQWEVLNFRFLRTAAFVWLNHPALPSYFRVGAFTQAFLLGLETRTV